MFNNSEVKQIEDLCASVKDWKESMTTEIKKRDEQLQRLGASTGSVADRIGNLEDTYLKSLEPALKNLHTEYADVKSALEKIHIGQQLRDQAQVAKAQPLSLGMRVVQSEAYKNALQRVTGDDVRAFRNMSPIGLDRYNELKSYVLGDVQTKYSLAYDTGTSNSIRDIQTTLRLQELFSEPLRPSTMREIIPVIPIQANSLEYWQQTDYASDGIRTNAWTGNNAAIVAEGASKPYSSVRGELKTALVSTLAHIFVISEQLMADAPAFAAHIDAYMRGGLDEKEEMQILKGSGTGGNLEGILTQTAIRLIDQDVVGVSGEGVIQFLCRALQSIKLNNYTPDNVLVGVGTETNLKLQTGNDGQFLWGTQNVAAGQTPRLWGVAVRSSNALEPYEGVMGNFRRCLGLLDRMNTTLAVTNSHEDLFEKNLLAMRYEKRIGMLHLRPAGMARLAFTNLTS